MTAVPPPEGPIFTTGPLRWRAPVGRHRRPDRSRAGAVLGTVALLAAVVAAGGAIAERELSADQQYREFVSTGQVGAPVSALAFEVTVLGVRTAAVITDRPGWRHDTSGVWVLVQIRAEARREPAAIGYAAVRDSRGRTWQATGRIGQPILDPAYRLEPGIPVEAEIAFEVPPEAATDLTLRLGDSSVFGRQLQSVVEVGLPVDQAQVARGVAEPPEDADPVLLEPPAIRAAGGDA